MCMYLYLQKRQRNSLGKLNDQKRLEQQILSLIVKENRTTREAERVLKIIVVYKTQIWQDHKSVYRNTNTIRKTIIERCYTIDKYKLLCKRDSGEDGSDILLSLCLLKSHLATMYLFYNIFFVSYQSRTSTYQTTGTITFS